MSSLTDDAPTPNPVLPPNFKLPCDEPCEKSPAQDAQGQENAARLLKSAFYNALDICFDEVQQEPKRILMIGGCRQRDFAQHIALLLPGAEIVLLDTDPEEAIRAKEEICCRFQFATGPIEAMPLEDGHFDLVLAHNVFEFTTNWRQSLREIARVTANNGNFMVSRHRPTLWGLLSALPGMRNALRQSGVTLPIAANLPSERELITELRNLAPIGIKLSPLPWRIFMSAPLSRG